MNFIVPISQEQLDKIQRKGEGHWENRCWVANNPEPRELIPSNNPNFDPNSKCMWFRKEE